MTGIMSLKPNPLRQTLSDFLLGSSKNDCLTKFIDDPQDTSNMRIPLGCMIQRGALDKHFKIT
jgi:hypothetical protein